MKKLLSFSDCELMHEREKGNLPELKKGRLPFLSTLLADHDKR